MHRIKDGYQSRDQLATRSGNTQPKAPPKRRLRCLMMVTTGYSCLPRVRMDNGAMPPQYSRHLDLEVLARIRSHYDRIGQLRASPERARARLPAIEKKSAPVVINPGSGYVEKVSKAWICNEFMRSWAFPAGTYCRSLWPETLTLNRISCYCRGHGMQEVCLRSHRGNPNGSVSGFTEERSNQVYMENPN